MHIMQWFHFEGPRLDDAAAWMKRLEVRHLRTGLFRADSVRRGRKSPLNRQMEKLENFDTTAAFCFTPEHEGIAPHHTSPPKDPMYFADFCARMIERYAPAQQQKAVA